MSNVGAENTVNYDAQSDVLYLGARSGIEEEQVEIAPGISAELDGAGQVIGVEVLNASQIFKGVTKSLESKSLQATAQIGV